MQYRKQKYLQQWIHLKSDIKEKSDINLEQFQTIKVKTVIYWRDKFSKSLWHVTRFIEVLDHVLESWCLELKIRKSLQLEVIVALPYFDFANFKGIGNKTYNILYGRKKNISSGCVVLGGINILFILISENSVATSLKMSFLLLFHESQRRRLFMIFSLFNCSMLDAKRSSNHNCSLLPMNLEMQQYLMEWIIRKSNNLLSSNVFLDFLHTTSINRPLMLLISMIMYECVAFFDPV